jgi:aryl-alcohol dehydrogenase (NADP+)
MHSQETSRAASDDYSRQLYDDERDMPVVERLRHVAQRLEVPPAQLALAWLQHQKGVVAPIVGATRLSHLDDAVASLHIRLEADTCRELEEPYRPHPVLGHH